MKYGVLASILVLAFAAPALAHNCSCTAPDGSCSTSVSCPDGCWALCGTGGHCSSGCETAGGDGEKEPRQQNPNPLVMPGSGADLVSLNATDLTGDDLAGFLGDALGSEVRFVPVDPVQTYSIDVIDVPPQQLAKALAEFGVVAVGGDDGKARIAARGAAAEAATDAEVTINLEETTIGDVVGLLDQLVGESGLSLQVTDPSAPFSLEVQEMPLKQLLTALEEMGAVKVSSGS